MYQRSDRLQNTNTIIGTTINTENCNTVAHIQMDTEFDTDGLLKTVKGTRPILLLFSFSQIRINASS